MTVAINVASELSQPATFRPGLGFRGPNTTAYQFNLRISIAITKSTSLPTLHTILTVAWFRWITVLHCQSLRESWICEEQSKHNQRPRRYPKTNIELPYVTRDFESKQRGRVHRHSSNPFLLGGYHFKAKNGYCAFDIRSYRHKSFGIAPCVWKLVFSCVHENTPGIASVVSADAISRHSEDYRSWHSPVSALHRIQLPESMRTSQLSALGSINKVLGSKVLSSPLPPQKKNQKVPSILLKRNVYVM